MSWRPKHPVRLVSELVAFVVVAVVAALVVVTSVLNVNTASTRAYHAVLTDASGLRSGDTVKIAGINVGTIDRITLDGDQYVKITFDVNTGQTVYRSTHATIKYANLIGTRYLDLTTADGQPRTPLRSGGTIPVSQTAPALDLTAVFNGFQPLFDALTPGEINQLTGSIINVFQGQSSTVANLVQQIGTITQNLAGRKQVIQSVITNLAGVLTSVNSQGTALGQVVDNFGQVVSNLAGQKDVLAQAITAMGAFTTGAARLTQQSSSAITADIGGVSAASRTLSQNSAAINALLQGAPAALQALDGSLNAGTFAKVYLCNLTLTDTGSLNLSLVPGLRAPQSPVNVSLPSGTVGSAPNSGMCR